MYILHVERYNAVSQTAIRATILNLSLQMYVFSFMLKVQMYVYNFMLKVKLPTAFSFWHNKVTAVKPLSSRIQNFFL